MEEIKKLDLESKDVVAEKVEQLKQLFPEIVTEGDGTVDWERLKETLGEEVNEDDERYAFTWPGKHDAIRLSQTPSTATLRPCKEESVDWDNTENLYIEGDNLEVLKLLQRSYAGKIKMIYIDPPYNTGHDFVYKDKFENTVENYKEQCGLAGQANADTSGRFHSDWCSMMLSRLSLAKNLLSDDGAIFISIDDSELANLIQICDQVFGPQNKIGYISRATGTTTGQDANKIGNSLDYCVSYAKSQEFNLLGLPLSEKDKQRFKDSDDKGQYSYLQLRKTGKNDRREDRPNMYYPIQNPNDKTIFPIGPTGYESRWRVERKTYEKLVEDDLIIWKEKTMPNGSNVLWPYVKYYLEGRTKQLSNLFTDIEGNKKASTDLKSLLGKKGIFDAPKPIEFLVKLFQASTLKDDIVLDFFSGSATSAHAVMKLNAEDGGNRKYIMVQLPEATDEKSEAYMAGYKNICEIGQERIRRAGRQIKEEIENSSKQLAIDEEPKNLPDIGFKVLKLDESNIETPQDGQMLLETVKSDRSDLDLVYEMMLKWGLELTAPVEEKEINGYKVFSIAADDTICCLQDGLTLEILQAIADLNPRKVLLKDSILDDTLKVNAIQIFKKQGDKTGLEIDLRTI